MNDNDKIAIELTRAQWGIIQQVIWKVVPCEVGVPLHDTIKQQLEGNGGVKKVNNPKFLTPADD